MCVRFISWVVTSQNISALMNLWLKSCARLAISPAPLTTVSPLSHHALLAVGADDGQASDGGAQVVQQRRASHVLDLFGAPDTDHQAAPHDDV